MKVNRFLNALSFIVMWYPITFLLIFLALGNPVRCQENSKTLISFDNGVVYRGMYNHFRVVAEQQAPVKLNQVRAFSRIISEKEVLDTVFLKITPYRNGFRLPAITDEIVNITILIEDGTEEQHKFYTRPLPAVVRVGGWGSNHTKRIPAIAFRSQQGLYAPIENLDINARCNVISYEIIRISTSNDAEVVTNEGGNFQLEAKRLVLAAQPGDRYIFTKIRYRCSGAQEDQIGETLYFELK